jgi:hypothetical protein
MKDTSLFPPLPRREFLRISATAVAGVAASTLVSPSSLFAAPMNVPLLGIGYSSSIPERGQRTSLISAANGVVASDPTFLSKHARVTVAGFGRAARYAKEPIGVELDAIFPVLSRTPDKYPTFHAWSYAATGNPEDHGGTISFKMPATAADGLTFIIQQTRPGAASSDPAKPPALSEVRSRVQLAINGDGEAKLARGAYVFAIRESAADSTPVWPYLSLENENGLLRVRGIDVTYVVVIVDYATLDEKDRGPKEK